MARVGRNEPSDKMKGNQNRMPVYSTTTPQLTEVFQNRRNIFAEPTIALYTNCLAKYACARVSLNWVAKEIQGETHRLALGIRTSHARQFTKKPQVFRQTKTLMPAVSPTCGGITRKALWEQKTEDRQLNRWICLDLDFGEHSPAFNHRMLKLQIFDIRGVEMVTTSISGNGLAIWVLGDVVPESQTEYREQWQAAAAKVHEITKEIHPNFEVDNGTHDAGRLRFLNFDQENLYSQRVKFPD